MTSDQHHRGMIPAGYVDTSPPAEPDPTGETGEAQETEAPPQPGAARLMWRDHKRSIAPFLYLPAIDGAAFATHALAHGPLPAALTAAGTGAGAWCVGALRTRKRAKAYRRHVSRTIVAATVWGIAAAAGSPTGWDGITQWALLAGGSFGAGRNVFLNRLACGTGDPDEEEPEPIEDPRLTAFIRAFCGDHGGPLRGAHVRLTEFDRGFEILMYFPESSPATTTAAAGLATQIAKLYDVPADRVSAGYMPANRSEARAKVTVVTAPDVTAAKADRWDGRSTYDNATGTIRLGQFVDAQPTRYLLHMPGSGAALGMVGGVIGAGKTGTLHVIAADAGQATMCARCGADRSCAECDPRRMIAVWMGDPQKLPFGVWRRKADLVGWGVEGCMELLQLAVTVAEARADMLGELEWFDHVGRHNVGKSSFDPEPGMPLILIPIDEWPLLVNHDDKDVRDEAMACAAKGATTFRKVGIHLLWGTQIIDLSQTGLREIREMAVKFNAIAHRADALSSNMLGIKADPTKLDPSDAGVGYIAGYDTRPDIAFHTKFMRDQLRPGERGTDIRHLADRIAATPIDYDPAVLAAFDAFKIGHQDVLTDWRGRPGTPTGDVTPDAPASGGPGIGGLPTRDDVDAVQAALNGRPAADLFDLMETTGLSMQAVGRALDLLAANGHITRSDGDEYTAAS